MLQIKHNEIKKHNLEFPLKALIYKMKPLEIVLCSYTGYLGNDKMEFEIDVAHSDVILSTLGYTMVLEMTTIGSIINMNINLIASVLHNVPHPLILGKQSKLQQMTTIRMDCESSIVFLDSFVVGRVFMEENYDFICASNRCAVYYENELVVFEKTLLTPANILFRPFLIHGTLLLINYEKKFHSLYSKELSLAVSTVKYKDAVIGQIIRIGAQSSDYFWQTIQNMVF